MTRGRVAVTSGEWVIRMSVCPASDAIRLRRREDLGSRRRVEVPRRLVGQDHLGAVHERAGDGDALLLAAGQLRGQVVPPRAEPDGVQELGGAGAAFGRRHGGGRRGRLDVLARGQGRDQVELLEDESDRVAPQARELPLGDVQQVPSVAADGPERSAGRARRAAAAGSSCRSRSRRRCRGPRRGRSTSETSCKRGHRAVAGAVGSSSTPSSSYIASAGSRGGRVAVAPVVVVMVGSSSVAVGVGRRSLDRPQGRGGPQAGGAQAAGGAGDEAAQRREHDRGHDDQERGRGGDLHEPRCRP